MTFLTLSATLNPKSMESIPYMTYIWLPPVSFSLPGASSSSSVYDLLIRNPDEEEPQSAILSSGAAHHYVLYVIFIDKFEVAVVHPAHVLGPLPRYAAILYQASGQPRVDVGASPVVDYLLAVQREGIYYHIGHSRLAVSSRNSL